MDAMCMTMILPDQTAELSYSAADHLINPTLRLKACNCLWVLKNSFNGTVFIWEDTVAVFLSLFD
jgi:hypothetical protein